MCSGTLFSPAGLKLEQDLDAQPSDDFLNDVFPHTGRLIPVGSSLHV